MLLFTLSLPFLLSFASAHIQRFVTRPHDRAISIKVEKRADADTLSPGLFFLTPYHSDFEAGSYGPHIFDADGQLIWYGNHSVTVRALDAHPCRFRSSTKDHICFNDAQPTEQGGHSSGVIRILDRTYTEVFSSNSTNNLRSPDIHECNTPEASAGKTLIKDVYQVVSANLTEFDSYEDGHVLSGCFQEINIPSGSLVFQWCSLDHVPLNTTRVYTQLSKHHQYTNPISGFGGPKEPWDYFHINSVDKDDDGDYFASGRHTNGVYKIAGNFSPSGQKPGSILWRLNDKYSDFLMLGDANSTAVFARQHHVRFLRQYMQPSTGQHFTSNQTHTLLSLFDNASDGYFHTKDRSSSAKILLLTHDNSTSAKKAATLLHQISQPSNSTASSQGSVSMLPNGNALIGWGSLPRYSEHAPDGRLLYYASFGGGLQNYRIGKAPWVGRPNTVPDIVAYKQHCGAESHIYVSWNGATDVISWRFYASDKMLLDPSSSESLDSHAIAHGKRQATPPGENAKIQGNTTQAATAAISHVRPGFYQVQASAVVAASGSSSRRRPRASGENIISVPKIGFETHVTLPFATTTIAWIYAVAFDKDGVELGRSRPTPMHVPLANTTVAIATATATATTRKTTKSSSSSSSAKCGRERCEDWSYDYALQPSGLRWCLGF